MLVEAFRSTCLLWLSEKDKETLIDAGLIDPNIGVGGSKLNVEMANMLRITTIDNFQGEEAKLVIP